MYITPAVEEKDYDVMYCTLLTAFTELSISGPRQTSYFSLVITIGECYQGMCLWVQNWRAYTCGQGIQLNSYAGGQETQLDSAHWWTGDTTVYTGGQGIQQCTLVDRGYNSVHWWTGDTTSRGGRSANEFC